MADIYNVVRGDGVFFEGMTKEQIYELIAEMTGETVQDIDQAFITKLKEINKGNAIRLWIGTSAEYNALTTREDDVLYICTDDTFVSDTNLEIQKLWDKIQNNYDAVTETLEEQNTNIEQFEENVTQQLNTFGNACRITTSSKAFNSAGESYTLPTLSVGEIRRVDWTAGDDFGYPYDENVVAVFNAPSSGTYMYTIYSSETESVRVDGESHREWYASGVTASYLDILTWDKLGTHPSGTSEPAVGSVAYYGSGYLLYWRIK